MFFIQINIIIIESINLDFKLNVIFKNIYIKFFCIQNKTCKLILKFIRKNILNQIFI